jgi:hypothetical protein
VDLGTGATWHDLETTAFDGTTAELFSNDVLAGEFGMPAGGTKPKAASSPMSAPGPAAGSARRPAVTTTGRTPASMSWPARCGKAC